MEVILTGSAFNTGVSLKTYIMQKVSNFNSKFSVNKIHKIHIVLNKEGGVFNTKIDVREEFDSKGIINANTHDSDAYKCFDNAIKTIERQIYVAKERHISGIKKQGTDFKNKIHNNQTKNLDIVDESYNVIEDEEDIK